MLFSGKVAKWICVSNSSCLPLQALHETLAEILQAASEEQQQQAQQAQQHDVVLARQAHWAATVPALAQHPALHLAARQALHSWLAASGAPSVWRLLLLYLRAVRRLCAQQLRGGSLPPELSLLYPVHLAGCAALLHCQRPTGAGLQRLVSQLQLAVACGSSSSSVEHQQQEAAEQQVWQLQLDSPDWLLFALRQLPLQQLLDLAAADAADANKEGYHGSSAVQQAALPPDNSEGSVVATAAAAAEYAALLLWPGQPRRRAVLLEALFLQLGDVDLSMVQPWIQTLLSWQSLLLPMSTARVCVADQTDPHEGVPWS